MSNHMGHSIDIINANIMIHQIIIIGGGCAGLTAAIYASRSELNPIVFAGTPESKGGMLVKTSVVENYPGFPDGIEGFDLIENIENQAKKYGAQIIDKDVISVDFTQVPFMIIDENLTKHYARTVIIATGSKPNKLGLENEDKMWSKGISSCAVCDGALFRNKHIVVVGGGDSAMEEALFLTKFSRVTLIHRKDTFRASKVMQNRVISNPKIDVLYDTTVEKLIGSQKLEAIEIKNHKTKETQILTVDGMFYGLGLHPNTRMFKHKLDMDKDECIIINSKQISGTDYKFTTMTSVPGVFVAGDAQSGAYRQAIVASSDGCKAALDADNYLNILNIL